MYFVHIVSSRDGENYNKLKRFISLPLDAISPAGGLSMES
jgi:hypothetical protein